MSFDGRTWKNRDVEIIGQEFVAVYLNCLRKNHDTLNQGRNKTAIRLATTLWWTALNVTVNDSFPKTTFVLPDQVMALIQSSNVNTMISTNESYSNNHKYR